MTTGNLEPLSKLTDWQWKEAMVRGCDMIDEFLKGLEHPRINLAVAGKSFPKLTEKFPLLTERARRDVEVLVYGRYEVVGTGTDKVRHERDADSLGR